MNPRPEVSPSTKLRTDGEWNRTIRSQKPEVRIFTIKKIFSLFSVLCFLFSVIGCDAFVRKFTRKPKRVIPKEEFVLVPEEYEASQISKEERYRQYFLFWKAWHDELINSLSIGASYKKQISCVNETIKNLEQMKALLNEMKQKELDIYINQMNGLKDSLLEDLYGNIISKNHLTAERIKRNIFHNFTYNKIKGHMS